MTTYTKCTETVLNMAREMIDKYHPDLEDAMIGFLFRDEAQMSKGKLVLAAAKKAPAWIQPYAELEFLIIIAEDEWNKMQDSRRMALIDHELSHCTFRKGEPKIVGHDFEEFHHIIERHGLWTMDLFVAKDRFDNAQKELEGFEMPSGTGKVVTIDNVVTNDNLEAVTEELFEKP